jgi:hypothetical protein
LEIVKSDVTAGPVYEPGGTFSFQVVITNPSAVDTATISSMTDTYGTIDPATDCDKTVLLPGESATCTFTAYHAGDPGQEFKNTVTVVATDDDGASVGGDSNEVTVTLQDAPAVPLVIVKLIANPSAVDTVTLTSVSDTYGTPDCGGVTSLAPGASVTCTFSVEHLGIGGDSWTNTVSVVASDDDGAPVGGNSNPVTVSLTSPPPGTGTPGYWRNHPDAWPVEQITIGGVIYTKHAAIAIMDTPERGDKTYSMFRALIAAKLNVLVDNESSCIAGTIGAADTWMATYGPVGSGVRAGGRDSPWQDGDPLYQTLDAYNNGQLCAPSRD